MAYSSMLKADDTLALNIESYFYNALKIVNDEDLLRYVQVGELHAWPFLESTEYMEMKARLNRFCTENKIYNMQEEQLISLKELINEKDPVKLTDNIQKAHKILDSIYYHQFRGTYKYGPRAKAIALGQLQQRQAVKAGVYGKFGIIAIPPRPIGEADISPACVEEIIENTTIDEGLI